MLRARPRRPFDGDWLCGVLACSGVLATYYLRHPQLGEPAVELGPGYRLSRTCDGISEYERSDRYRRTGRAVRRLRPLENGDRVGDDGAPRIVLPIMRLPILVACPRCRRCSSIPAHVKTPAMEVAAM